MFFRFMPPSLSLSLEYVRRMVAIQTVIRREDEKERGVGDRSETTARKIGPPVREMDTDAYAKYAGHVCILEDAFITRF